MSKHDNDNLGVCGLCGRDPQKLEAEIERLRAENASLHEEIPWLLQEIDDLKKGANEQV